MSVSKKVSSGWMRQNYDKLLLVVMLVLLLASAIYLLLKISVEKKEIEDNAWAQQMVRPIAAEPVDLGQYRSNLVVASLPFMGTDLTDNRMVSSGERVTCVNGECGKPIPFAAETCPFCGAEQPDVTVQLDRDSDGIPDEDEERLGLDPFDPNDALMDLDEDGFTNIEEFEFGSDLDDPDSSPPPGKKLRLVMADRQPLNLLFKGLLDREDGVAFQINALNSGRTFFRSIGEEVEGYLVETYRPEDPAGPTLVLRRGEATLDLVRGESRETEDWSAVLISLLDGTRYGTMQKKIKQGEDIEIRGFTYKVVDIKRMEVLIQDANSGKSVTVGKVTRAEIADLKMRMQQMRRPPR